MRLAWLYAHVRSAGGVFLPSITEGQRVGVALATSNHFADPFSAPSGATAHLSPFFPFLIGLIYRIFGVATERAEIVLSVLSILLVSLSFYLCFRVFRKLGASWLACIAGLAVAALLPLQVNLEASELRVWESPLLIAGILALLLWALRLDEKALVSWKVVMTMAVAAGLLILVNPVGALSAYAIIAVLIVTRAPRRRWLPFGAALAFTGLLVATPWAWRNHEILGRTIWTRSNAGLELALAYNDTMYSGRDGRAAYLARLEQIHPAKGPRGMAALQQAGGEISYSRSLSDETWIWISRNPAPAASLVARHARDYLLPPTWFFNTPSGPTLRRARPYAL